MSAAPALRALLPWVSLCMLAAASGCATHQAYGDAAVPESARATIVGYSRYAFLYFEDLRIMSVDGEGPGGPGGSPAAWPYASSASVPSGRHSIRILILRNETDIASCAFAWTFEAGHRYKIEHLRHGQFLLAHPVQPRFPASIGMAIVGPSGKTQASAPAECAVRGAAPAGAG